MSDGHTSSSPPIDSLPRHDHLRSNLKVVPEDERLSAAVTSVAAGYKGAGSGRRGQPRPRHRATPSKVRGRETFSLLSFVKFDLIKDANRRIAVR